MAGARIAVRERIAPEITASLFANYRSSAEAVMELVDNAVDSRVAGGPLQVEITVHPGSLTVFTHGGTGMGIRDLERHYLRWGAAPRRGRQMLGQYVAEYEQRVNEVVLAAASIRERRRSPRPQGRQLELLNAP